MLTTPHVLLGIFLITKLPWPISLPLALLSHFAVDFVIPHWNPHLYTEIKRNGRLSPKSLLVIAGDGFLATTLVAYFSFTRQSLLPALAAAMTTAPDWVEIPYYFWGMRWSWLKKYVTFEHQHQARAKFWGGITTQLVLVGVLLWVLCFTP